MSELILSEKINSSDLRNAPVNVWQGGVKPGTYACQELIEEIKPSDLRRMELETTQNLGSLDKRLGCDPIAVVKGRNGGMSCLS